ncbi:MAG: hypothetical protein C4336_06050, partial [Armatimonadota bacterium]
ERLRPKEGVGGSNPSEGAILTKAREPMKSACLGTLALLCATAQSPLQITLVDPAPRPNLIRNSSFEEVQNAHPLGWSWDPRTTQASMSVVSEPGAVGKLCLRFTNTTPSAPEQYALLRYEGGVPVRPSTVYTLTCRYKTRTPLVGFVGGGQKWRVRLPLENTDDQWRTASLTFATLDDETQFDLVIVIEAPTDGLWIDALKLEEHPNATPYVPAEPLSHPMIILPPLPNPLYCPAPEWQTDLELYTPQPLPNAHLEVQLGRQSIRLQRDLPAGTSKVAVRLKVPRESHVPLQVRIRYGKQTVSAKYPLTVFTRAQAEARLNALRRRLPQWQAQLQQLQRKGHDVAYPQATFTVLKQFVSYVAEDLRHGRIERAFAQIHEMEPMAKRLETTLRACLSGRCALPPVPRYLTSPITVQGVSFVAEVQNPLTGQRQRQPAFFVGFGGSEQVHRDLEQFPLMGFNLVQIGCEVQNLLPEPGQVNQQALRAELLGTFERARRANVAVDLLVSPHSIPARLSLTSPHLKQEREGAIPHSLFSPDSLSGLREYLTVLLPPLRTEPTLFSLCLSDKPDNRESSQSSLGVQAWHQWLQKRHKTLITLNTRWRTQYSSWDEIPIPSEGVPYTEWLEFNADALADWHRQLAQIATDLLPHTPKHAKLTVGAFLNDQELALGVDPEQFAPFCDLNGNSTASHFIHDPSTPWAFDWIRNWMAYDLQCSVKESPIFNSENRILSAKEPRSVPPAYARAVLWEGAVRGMSATIFWGWERTDGSPNDAAGSLLHHPAIVEALAHTTLDLNRLAPAVSALQNQPYEIHLLHARTDLAMQGPEQIVPRDSLYIALTMLGVRVGFVTEQQLIAGRVPESVKRILIPNVRYLSDEALFALDQLRQRRGILLLSVGDPVFVFDLYGRRRTTRLP